MTNSSHFSCKLTIAIPTYNRAKRLEKSLAELLNQIQLSSNKSDLSVFVSNNGSSDETADIIEQASLSFSQNNIPFKSRNACGNEGFDANVIACYRESMGQYVWLLSDDDNLMPGSIDAVFSDILRFKAYVIYYNFDQTPYTKENPYILSHEYFEQVDRGNISAIGKIIKWPKLSALVIRRCESGFIVPDLKSGFAHITLALQVGLAHGKIIHSSTFIAFPDLDFMDHIDFVPFVGNYLNKPIQWALAANGKESLWELLEYPHTDPLTSSLESLKAYYQGYRTLTIPLKRELWSVCLREMSTNWQSKVKDQADS
jgi:glycosyltransferase involved in cell wall biosynthesis